MTGLVAGSICPDFEYFFRLDVYSYYGHTWKGIFWFDLPLSILLAFVFHLVARDPLIDNLPAFLAKRLTVFKTFNWTKHFKEYYPAVIVSVIIGAASVTSHAPRKISPTGPAQNGGQAAQIAAGPVGVSRRGAG